VPQRGLRAPASTFNNVIFSGKPDSEVVKNTNEIKENNKEWEKQGEIAKQLSKKNQSGPSG
jgi:hypothetical protein